MTDNQMKLIRKQLPARSQIPWKDWTEEQQRIDSELSCIDMINSILAYGGFGYDAETVIKREEQSYHNYLYDYVKEFGREKIIELIQEQINSIERIAYNIHTDSEGCSYNAIIWKEE